MIITLFFNLNQLIYVCIHIQACLKPGFGAYVQQDLKGFNTANTCKRRSVKVPFFSHFYTVFAYICIYWTISREIFLQHRILLFKSSMYVHLCLHEADFFFLEKTIIVLKCFLILLFIFPSLPLLLLSPQSK